MQWKGTAADDVLNESLEVFVEYTRLLGILFIYGYLLLLLAIGQTYHDGGT